MKLNERIKELRLEKELSQIELAKVLSVTRSTITKWETGDRTPSLQLLIAMTKIFDCTLGYLVGIED